MMKKIAALLLFLFMLGSLATAETVDYAGVWYLVSAESGGIPFNPADIGMEMVMTLNADGTGVITMSGEEDKAATWVSDGEILTVTAKEQPRVFTLTADGQLVAENEGSKLIFGREAAAPGFVPAAEIAAPDVAAFNGTWTITTVNVGGMYVPFSAMAQAGLEDAAVVIQDGIVMSLGAQETGTFADGKLEIASQIEGMAGKSFSLLEDGTLAMTYMEIVFYCAKAEDVE